MSELWVPHSVYQMDKQMTNHIFFFKSLDYKQKDVQSLKDEG